MRHSSVEKYFLELVEGTLSDKVKGEVEAHLTECAECAKALEGYKQVLRVERLIAEEQHALGPEFRVHVMEALDSKVSPLRQVVASFQGSWTKMIGVPVALVATACLAFVIAHDQESAVDRVLRQKQVAAPAAVEVAQPLKLTEDNRSNEEVGSISETQVPLMPSDQRAVTIDVDQVSGVEGFVKPGTKVDLLATVTDSEGKSKTAVISQEVEVLSSGGNTAAGSAGENGKDTVTLAIPKEEASKIQTAKSQSKLSLALRGDREASSPSGQRMLSELSANAAPRQQVTGYVSVRDEKTGEKKAFMVDDRGNLLAEREEYDGASALGGGYADRVGKESFTTSDFAMLPPPNEREAAPRARDYRRLIYPPPMPPSPPVEQNVEVYGQYDENPRLLVSEQPLSTFSIDVDTGSFSNARRFLSMGNLPPKDSVRVEEFINAFDYHYPTQTEKPFAVYSEVAPSPLEEGRYLLKLGVKARDLGRNEDNGWNLVFLLDTSGSMAADNKMGMLKRSLEVLVREMRSIDRVAIVTFATSAQVALPSESGMEKERILSAIQSLQAAGSTNGGAGLDLAYSIASQNKRNDGVNRVILITDGDFNAGNYQFDGLMRMIEEKRSGGITLTTIGVGEGNYNERNLEQLANRGNGNYFYLDSFEEARKVFSEKLVSNLEIVAKDVKLQVEFNPTRVKAYRLIGYDNRKLENTDFKNDAVDAGEIGSGHTVTALYEIILTDSPLPVDGSNEELRYQPKMVKEEEKPISSSERPDELAFVKIRFKTPTGNSSEQLEFPVERLQVLSDAKAASDDFRFAVGVSYVAQILRESKYRGHYSLRQIVDLLKGATGSDERGERRDFIKLVENIALRRE